MKVESRVLKSQVMLIVDIGLLFDRKLSCLQFLKQRTEYIELDDKSICLIFEEWLSFVSSV